jgi:hypothetical protein
MMSEELLVLVGSDPVNLIMDYTQITASKMKAVLWDSIPTGWCSWYFYYTMPDQYEIDNGLDPETDDAGADHDNDGMPNIYEYENDLDPTVNDADLDADGDGASNLDEYEAGTSAADPNDTPSSIPWMLIIIGIIVLALIVAALMFMKKKGPGPAQQTAPPEPEFNEGQEMAPEETVSGDVPPPEDAAPDGEFTSPPEELPPPPPE